MDKRFRGRNLNKGYRIFRPVSEVLGPYPRGNGLMALRDWPVNECCVSVKPDSQTNSQSMTNIVLGSCDV